ncbi:SMAD/FHA domain [Ceraceosorus bombacis]|uniref:SMAD/FHA domain n=1 Tax=Ceraceosorus bombacis TaxID=401625 RepID=A0A0P1BHC2_9BASI|nr:SMAD/FHA domain [Ceraceosorus bombacis]
MFKSALKRLSYGLPSGSSSEEVHLQGKEAWADQSVVAQGQRGSFACSPTQPNSDMPQPMLYTPGKGATFQKTDKHIASSSLQHSHRLHHQHLPALLICRPQSVEEEETYFELREGYTRIGREESNELRLVHAGIESVHLRLEVICKSECSKAQVMLRVDAASGLTLNDVHLQLGSTVQLDEGDTFQLNAWNFKLVSAAAAGAAGGGGDGGSGSAVAAMHPNRSLSHAAPQPDADMVSAAPVLYTPARPINRRLLDASRSTRIAAPRDSFEAGNRKARSSFSSQSNSLGSMRRADVPGLVYRSAQELTGRPASKEEVENGVRGRGPEMREVQGDSTLTSKSAQGEDGHGHGHGPPEKAEEASKSPSPSRAAMRKALARKSWREGRSSPPSSPSSSPRAIGNSQADSQTLARLTPSMQSPTSTGQALSASTSDLVPQIVNLNLSSGPNLPSACSFSSRSSSSESGSGSGSGSSTPSRTPTLKAARLAEASRREKRVISLRTRMMVRSCMEYLSREERKRRIAEMSNSNNGHGGGGGQKKQNMGRNTSSMRSSKSLERIDLEQLKAVGSADCGERRQGADEETWTKELDKARSAFELADARDREEEQNNKGDLTAAMPRSKSSPVLSLSSLELRAEGHAGEAREDGGAEEENSRVDEEEEVESLLSSDEKDDPARNLVQSHQNIHLTDVAKNTHDSSAPARTLDMSSSIKKSKSRWSIVGEVLGTPPASFRTEKEAQRIPATASKVLHGSSHAHGAFGVSRQANASAASPTIGVRKRRDSWLLSGKALVLDKPQEPSSEAFFADLESEAGLQDAIVQTGRGRRRKNKTKAASRSAQVESFEALAAAVDAHSDSTKSLSETLPVMDRSDEEGARESEGQGNAKEADNIVERPTSRSTRSKGSTKATLKDVAPHTQEGSDVMTASAEALTSSDKDLRHVMGCEEVCRRGLRARRAVKGTSEDPSTAISDAKRNDKDEKAKRSAAKDEPSSDSSAAQVEAPSTRSRRAKRAAAMLTEESQAEAQDVEKLANRIPKAPTSADVPLDAVRVGTRSTRGRAAKTKGAEEFAEERADDAVTTEAAITEASVQAHKAENLTARTRARARTALRAESSAKAEPDKGPSRPNTGTSTQDEGSSNDKVAPEPKSSRSTRSTRSAKRTQSAASVQKVEQEDSAGSADRTGKKEESLPIVARRTTRARAAKT